MLQDFKDARNNVRAKIIGVLQTLANTNKKGLKAIENNQVDELKSIRKTIKSLHKETEEIDNDVVLILAKYTPEARDLREMVSYLKITTSLNRVQSNIFNYLKGVQNLLNEEDEKLLELVKGSLGINRYTEKAFEYVLKMLATLDDEDKIKSLTSKIEVEYSKSEDTYTLLEKEVSQNLCNAEGLTEEYFSFLKQIRKNLKIIDRLDSIAGRIIFARMGGKL